MEKILIILTVLIGLGLLYVFYLSPHPDHAKNDRVEYVPVHIGSVEVCDIPKDSVVDFKDDGIAPRLERLYSEGKALLFHASKMAGTILALEKVYSEAADSAREEISKFIETVVEIASGRIVDCEGNEAVCRNLYVSVSRVFSRSVQTGSKVILKYRYLVKGVGWMCNVVILYDPSLALEAIVASEKIRSTLERAGVDPEAFVREIEEVMNEVKNR